MDFVKPSQWICTVAIAAVFASAVVIDSAAEASEAVTADELLCEFQTRARGEAVPVIGMRSCETDFGYLKDIHSALHSSSLVHPQYGMLKSLYCAPTLRAEEIAQILEAHAQTHPEKLQCAARTVWLDAMIEAFPCAE